MADKDKKDIVTIAKKRFTRALDAYKTNRIQAVEDTRFVMGDSDNGWQWPSKIRSSRTLNKKVCLTVNLTAQHCNQIINAIRQNRPTGKVSPVDNGADIKTAQFLGSLARNIQKNSDADSIHDLGAEHAIYGGEGYWRVVTEYADDYSRDQCIRILPIDNPQLVLIDCDAKQLDKSDSEWGFIFEDIPREQAEREYKGIDVETWSEATRLSDWHQKKADEELVRIAEYFWCEHEKQTICGLDDGSVVLESEVPDGIIHEWKREVDVKNWKWCKLVGGEEMPVDEKDWPGKYLPIISVIGKELNVNGEIIRKGIVRDLKDPARMVNYAYSECVQTLALQNKVPYMAAAEAIDGYETIWGNANIEDRSYLPYNAFDDTGQALPQPTRQTPPIMPSAQVELLQLSVEQMRAASGQQNANFGIKSEAQSGVGIQRLKQQGEVATFHFPDNLSRALRYEMAVIIDLIQKVYDTRRVERILGLDGTEQPATIDPTIEQAYMEVEDAENQDIKRIFNPQVGRYDVAIDTGPSYMTQRQEGATALNELASRDPNLMNVAGDLIMRAQDFPFAEELAQRLAKTIPPELLNEDDNPQLAKAMQVIEQMKGEMAGMKQMLEKAETSLDAREVAVKEYDAETKRISALGSALDEEKVQEIILGTLQAMQDTGGLPSAMQQE